MSEIEISSTGWLAISLGNGNAGVFDLHDTHSWQYLQSESIVEQSEDKNLNRNLIKFSPNGEILVVNGQNKQLYVYIQIDFEKSEVWWQLEKQITVGKPISALDLTNEFLLIADKNGDVYKVDLAFNDTDKNLIVTSENRIMEHLSVIRDIAFIPVNDKKSFILTADQDEEIRLNHYPNSSNSQGFCLGHTEFVSHIKLIDNHHFLSVSGDGTIRLWHLPDCVPLFFLHSKAFILSSKQIFYTQLYNPKNISLLDNYRTDSMPEEPAFNSSSTINYSIWKMDVASFGSIVSNVYIAFSIYAYRSHSIYLTSLSNMKELANEQRKLTLDSSYGTIVDYCFSSKDILINDYIKDSKCYLYILFNSNTLLKVDIISILLCNGTQLFVQSDETIQEINTILARKEFHSMDCINNNRVSDDMIYNQLFKNHVSSYHKRKMESIEQRQRKRKASSQSEENISFVEHV